MRNYQNQNEQIITKIAGILSDEEISRVKAALQACDTLSTKALSDQAVKSAINLLGRCNDELHDVNEVMSDPGIKELVNEVNDFFRSITG